MLDANQLCHQPARIATVPAHAPNRMPSSTRSNSAVLHSGSILTLGRAARPPHRNPAHHRNAQNTEARSTTSVRCSQPSALHWTARPVELDPYAALGALSLFGRLCGSTTPLQIAFPDTHAFRTSSCCLSLRVANQAAHCGRIPSKMPEIPNSKIGPNIPSQKAAEFRVREAAIAHLALIPP